MERKQFVLKLKGIVRALDSSDSRNLNHLSYQEAWLNLARYIGRILADREWERVYGKIDGNASCTVC